MLSTTTVWIVFIVYNLIIGIIGVYSWKNQDIKSTHNYYTGKGSISTHVLIMTYLASLMSTWVFFAGPGGYYRGGLVFWFSELSYMPLFPVITYFVMNKVWFLSSQRNYITPADIYDDRFKSPALRAILAIVFLASSLPYVSSVLVAIGTATNAVSGGQIPYPVFVVIATVIMLIYVMLGGMRSVAWTDTIQGWIFMIILWAIVAAALFVGFGGSLGAALANVWKNTNSWFSYPGPEEWVPYSARFGYPLSCAIGWTIMLPHVFVRAGYSGQDLKSQHKLAFYVPFLQVFVWTATMLVGLLGIALLPNLGTAETELIIPYLINNVIQSASPWLAQILMIGFYIGAIAVGMSTANSFLLVAGSIISEDIMEKLLKLRVPYEKKLAVARWVIIVLGIISMLMAFKPPALIWTLIMFAIAIVMPLFPILIGALYWKRATSSAAVISSIAGVITVLLTYFWWNIGSTWYGAIGMLVSAALFIVVSLITKGADKAVLDDFYGTLEKAEAQHYE